MGVLGRIPVGQVAVGLSIIVALLWIFAPSGLALAASIIAGGLIALVAMNQPEAQTQQSRDSS